ncbi:hypothetical protein [uncultured Gammaproteobacteria bacterium]|nr:hypothetical protein [uncultured Gammaproteobacteria bacterium]
MVIVSMKDVVHYSLKNMEGTILAGIYSQQKNKQKHLLH